MKSEINENRDFVEFTAKAKGRKCKGHTNHKAGTKITT